MRKFFLALIKGFVILIVFFNVSLLITNASDTDVSGEVKQLKNETSAYSEKDVNSECIGVFKKDDFILVIEQDEKWLTIFYKGQMAYIPVDDGATDEVSELIEDVDQTGFEEEQREIQRDEIEYVNEMIAQEEKERRILVWRVMMLLIIAVVAVIIAMTFIKRRPLEENK